MNISESVLFDRYITKSLTLEQIGLEFNCSTATISRALKKFGLNYNIEKYIGQTFGKLTVLKFEGRDKHNHKTILAECDCGKIIEIPLYSLVTKNTSSCGCSSRKRGKEHALWKGYEEITSSYISSCIKGANLRNLSWNITPEIMWNQYIKQNRLCNLSGIPIHFALTRKKYKVQTASLDRIDNTLGYEPTNIQWLHKDINKMKMDLSQDRLIELCERIYKNAKNN